MQRLVVVKAPDLLLEQTVFALEALDDLIFLVEFLAHAFHHFFKLLNSQLVLKISLLLRGRDLLDVKLAQADGFDRRAPPVSRILILSAG